MIGQKIKKLREDAGLSQEQLAGEFEIGVTALYFYESGKRIPPSEIVVKYCRRFSVSADYLLGLSEEKKQQPISAPEELQADAAAVMEAAADLCSLEGSRSFSRSLLPFYKNILQALSVMVSVSDQSFRDLLQRFPAAAGASIPGELPPDLKLKALQQIASGDIEDDVREIVEASNSCEANIQQAVNNASVQIVAIIRAGIGSQLTSSGSRSAFSLSGSSKQ